MKKKACIKDGRLLRQGEGGEFSAGIYQVSLQREKSSIVRKKESIAKTVGPADDQKGCEGGIP